MLKKISRGQAILALILAAVYGLALDLTRIDWVIVGGESGPGARPMDPAWVLDLRNQCLNAGVAFFFKQWGGVQKKKAGRLLEKRTWDQMPREVALS